MEILGWIFLAIIALVVAAAVAMGVVSLPDARRYLKLRRM
jgi:TRAP-type mannitol/chloroaromatic compound transport system permease large subunit